MLSVFRNMFRIKDLRNKILYTFAALLVVTRRAAAPYAHDIESGRVPAREVGTVSRSDLEREALLEEMKRLTCRYILFISVNCFNPGFLSHRTVHRITPPAAGSTQE